MECKVSFRISTGRASLGAGFRHVVSWAFVPVTTLADTSFNIKLTGIQDDESGLQGLASMLLFLLEASLVFECS